jgi:hypothetical protein
MTRLILRSYPDAPRSGLVNIFLARGLFFDFFSFGDQRISLFDKAVGFQFEVVRPYAQLLGVGQLAFLHGQSMTQLKGQRRGT